MNPQYSKEERLFLGIAYENTKSYTEVKRTYHRKYGYQKTPSYKAVTRIHEKLMNEGSILNRNKGEYTIYFNARAQKI
jgi:hypothetical protein